MSDMQMFRTGEDGKRIAIDWHDGKTFDEKVQDMGRLPEGRGDPITRIGRFLEGLREAQTNPDYQPTSVIGRMLQFVVGRNDRDVDLLISDDPRTGGIGGNLTFPAAANQPVTLTSALDPEIVARLTAGFSRPSWANPQQGVINDDVPRGNGVASAGGVETAVTER